MDVSILVPVFNEAAHIQRALQAMLAQRFPGQFEILVMEGGSRDGTRSIVESVATREARVRAIENPIGTIPSALNLGLRAARGTYVARMDAHTYYPLDYLRIGLERLRRGDVAHVSGPATPHGVGAWSRRIALALGSALATGGGMPRRIEAEEEIEVAFTGIWRRDALLALGGWDESWIVNEDVELTARLRAEGGKLVCLPELAALHVPRDSLAALARQYWRYGTYRSKTAGRHPETMRPEHLLPPALTLAVLIAMSPASKLRDAARVIGLGYAAAISAESLRIGLRQRVGPRDVAALPLVFATMHLAWGSGFLSGSRRFGVPFGAVRATLGIAFRSGAVRLLQDRHGHDDRNSATAARNLRRHPLRNGEGASG